MFLFLTWDLGTLETVPTNPPRGSAIQIVVQYIVEYTPLHRTTRPEIPRNPLCIWNEEQRNMLDWGSSSEAAISTERSGLSGLSGC